MNLTYIYIFTNSSTGGFHKIGYSEDPMQTLSDLNNAHIFREDFELYRYYEVNGVSNEKALDEILNLFSDNSKFVMPSILRGFYKIDLELADKIITNILYIAGYKDVNYYVNNPEEIEEDDDEDEEEKAFLDWCYQDEINLIEEVSNYLDTFDLVFEISDNVGYYGYRIIDEGDEPSRYNWFWFRKTNHRLVFVYRESPYERGESHTLLGADLTISNIENIIDELVLDLYGESHKKKPIKVINLNKPDYDKLARCLKGWNIYKPKEDEEFYTEIKDFYYTSGRYPKAYKLKESSEEWLKIIIKDFIANKILSEYSNYIKLVANGDFVINHDDALNSIKDSLFVKKLSYINWKGVATNTGLNLVPENLHTKIIENFKKWIEE